MATPEESLSLNGLAKRLVSQGLLGEPEALHAQQQAAVSKIPLLAYLSSQNLIDGQNLAITACEEFGIPLLDIGALDLDSIPSLLVDEKLVKLHKVLPLYKRDTTLFVAVSDPTNLQALDEIKFNTGLTTEPILVEQAKLEAALEAYISSQEASLFNIEDTDLDNLDIDSDLEDLDSAVTESDVEDTPIVRFVNKILLDAINQGVSDIHFEPYEKVYRIRYRQDGVLREVATPPVNLGARLSARTKIMSQLDISERRIPQDGRIKMRLSKNRAIDFRVSTCPTLYGEKVVMRVLDPSSAKMGIDALGYEKTQKELFMNAIHKPQGMVLVTGPTGSGKTVSLYTALNILNTDERNISTAEDPVEINLAGINQVNVNPKVGLTFSSALRAFLRQDPDIVMVGEIRDFETAEIGIKAAQTGHLVLSTLHTNSAPETLTRLVNMGVEPFNIATSVTLIIAQRLARRLCEHCKKEEEVPKTVLLKHGFDEEEANSITLYSPVGCDNCVGGYRGRVGLYEVMPISDAMARLIMENANALVLADQMKAEGHKNLRQSGLDKVKEGITSLEEVNRVTTE